LAAAEEMKTLPQLADAATDLLNRAPQLTVTINRDHASRFGITPQLIDDTLNDAFGQRQVTQYYTQINTYWIILEVKPELQGLPSTLDRIYVKSPLTGGAVPLSTLVSVDSTKVGPLVVNHQVVEVFQTHKLITLFAVSAPRNRSEHKIALK
jgi:multidrug efflux pump subunit AcrB